MKRKALLFGLAIIITALSSCVEPPKQPVGPQSNVNVIPWNRGVAGEGGAGFGGALDPR